MTACQPGISRVGMAVILIASACTSSDQPPPSTVSSKKAECAWPASMDAVAAAPRNHRVLLDNDRVRVLEITVAPGEREPVHAHCLPAVSYVMYEGKNRDYDGQGNLVSEVKESPPASQFPMTSWTDPVAPHAVENLDTRPIHSLHIELKQ